MNIPSKIRHFAQVIDNPFSRVFLFLFTLGFFLRAYRFAGFVTYLGDQGRDALVMKDIITLQHLPAIGPASSVGGVYLGPFFYYLMSPWLLLTNFHPLGPAIGVLFFSLLFIGVAYFIISDLFKSKTALLSVFFIVFSEVLISFSRFSWNPNLLPFASLLVFYFLMKALDKKRTIFYVLLGIFLSISIQLHYVALALCFSVGIYLLLDLYKNREKLRDGIQNISITLFSFIITTSPLFIFDLRHNFLNARAFIKLFFESGSVSGSGLQGMLYTFKKLNDFTFASDVHIILSGLLLLVLLYVMYESVKKVRKERSLLLYFMLTIFATSLYAGNKIPHYFGALYPLYYTLIAVYCSKFLWTHAHNKATFRIILGIILALFIYQQSSGYYFLFNNPNNQIQKAQEISSIIRDNVTAKRYSLTVLPGDYGDYPYRYFLSITNKPPEKKTSMTRADELFVICEHECWPIGDPQWDIAFFAPEKIMGMWSSNNVTIYKLIRDH